MKTSQLSNTQNNTLREISRDSATGFGESHIIKPKQITSEQSNHAKTGSSNIYSYIVIGLLLLAAFALYGPKLLSGTEQSDAVSASDGHSYVSDLDFWRRTNRETHVASSIPLDLSNDLEEIPLAIGKWTGVDMPDTNREVEILLDPEQYVRRLYQHENGNYIWLSLIGGRSSKPFHAPDICYDADGWQYNLGSHPFALNNGGEIFGLWLEAEKEVTEGTAPLEHFVSYFYIFPDHDRELSDGIVLFKLTSSKFGTSEQSLEIHQDFVSSIFGGL